MKQNVKKGLEGLIAPQPTAKAKQEPTIQHAPERVKGNYKTVCYSLPVELTEKVRDIAYWDRKKINAVVSEALEQYVNKWVKKQDK